MKSTEGLDPDGPEMARTVNENRAETLRLLADEITRFVRHELDTSSHECGRCGGKRFNNFTQKQQAKQLEAMAGKLVGMAGHYKKEARGGRGR